MRKLTKQLRSVAFHYGLGGGACALLALYLIFFHQLVLLPALLLWVATGLLIISYAYSQHYGRLFRKRVDGRIPFWAKCIFFPFFVGIHIYNSIARRKDGEPALQEVAPGLYLGRRITPLDVPVLIDNEIEAILDVTAEFDALEFTAHELEVDYLNIPVLDHDILHKEDLKKALNWIHNHLKQSKNVVVHCALGKGRSASVVLAYVAVSQRSQSLEQTLKQIQDISPRTGPNSRQMRWLGKLYYNKHLNLHQKALLVANPVAGGAKWYDYKADILERLEQFLDVSVHETKQEDDIEALVAAALRENVDIVIAAGGDGTLTEVAACLVNAKSQAKFGIIPLGTANALSQVLLGSESFTNTVEASCRAIVGGFTQAMDTVKCNERISLLMIGLGFEKEMIEYADREQKNASGVGAYLQGFMNAVMKNKTLNVKITFDDEPPEEIITNSLVVANAAPRTSILAQGGGNPRISDGKVDVTWIHPSDTSLSRFTSLLDLWRVAEDRDEDSAVGHRRAQKLRIETDPPYRYVIDGELVGTTPLEIAVLPASLQVLVPEEFLEEAKSADDEK